jgi:hypothetical protein
LTDPLRGRGHHLRHGFRPVRHFQEIDMSKQQGSFSVRRAVERVFAGALSAAVCALVAGGTLAMCVPGAAGLVA